MKRLSPEFKVGLIAVLIIVLFIWLFSFLNGRNLFSSYDHYHVRYSNVAGLEPSSPVEISGLKAGIVNNVKLVNDGSGFIDVSLSIENNYKIPENSIAEITTATLIAGMKINLIMGSSPNMLKSGDEIEGRVAVSIIDKLDSNFDPLLDQTHLLLTNIDTLVGKLNLLFAPELVNNINAGAGNFEKSSRDIRQLLEENSDSLTELISNLKNVSRMLESNIERFDSTIYSVNKIAGTLAESDMDSTLQDLKHSLENSSVILDRLNKGEGSAGKFLNDDTLYINLVKSLESLEILLKDLESNPGKYVNFSIFGRKND